MVMIKAAIIGANGYLARNMAQLNLMNNYAEMRLYGYEEDHRDGLNPYERVDVFDESAMRKIVSQFDIIYFFTGRTGTLQGFDHFQEYLDLNEKALLTLLGACKSENSKAKIVFPSTRLVYKGQNELLSEESEKQFLTPYAIQKYACEEYLKMYSNLYGIRYCIARICVPYGSLVSPVTSHGTIEFFIKQANEKKEISIYGDGNQKRTFTYIEDLCTILWEMGLNEKCVNDIYNVGGESQSIHQVAKWIASATNSKIVELPWPKMDHKIETGSTAFNSNKLESLIQCTYHMSIKKWIQSRSVF